MMVRIYQMVVELDTQMLRFRDQEDIVVANGGEFPSELYECVYSCEMDVSGPEDIYYIFNCNLPKDYSGRSLSVSDVVELADSAGRSEFFYCDMVGFSPVVLDIKKTMHRIQNHDWKSYQKIRKGVHAYFINEHGLQNWACDKIVLERCQYSKSQLGYKLSFWPLGCDHPSSAQFLEKPTVIVTKFPRRIPESVLSKTQASETPAPLTYPDSEENLSRICEWLRHQNQSFEIL